MHSNNALKKFYNEATVRAPKMDKAISPRLEFLMAIGVNQRPVSHIKWRMPARE